MASSKASGRAGVLNVMGKSPQFKAARANADLDGEELPMQTPKRPTEEHASTGEKENTTPGVIINGLEHSVTYNALRDLGMKPTPAPGKQLFRKDPAAEREAEEGMRSRVPVRDLMGMFEQSPCSAGEASGSAGAIEGWDMLSPTGSQGVARDGFTPMRTGPLDLEGEITPAPAAPLETPDACKQTAHRVLDGFDSHAVDFTPAPALAFTPAHPAHEESSLAAHSVLLTPSHAPATPAKTVMGFTPSPPKAAPSLTAHAVADPPSPAPAAPSPTAHAVTVTPSPAPVALAARRGIPSPPSISSAEAPAEAGTGAGAVVGAEAEAEAGAEVGGAAGDGQDPGEPPVHLWERAIKAARGPAKAIEGIVMKNPQLLALVVGGVHLVCKNRRLMLERQPGHPKPMHRNKTQLKQVGAKVPKAPAPSKAKEAPKAPAPKAPVAAAAAKEVTVMPSGAASSKDKMFMG